MEGLNQKRRVVVVGGGVAGGLFVKHIQFDCDVVLIDPKEYFEIPWGGLRSMVEPSFAERTLINHSDYFTNGRLITSPAINVTDTEVLIAEGRSIPYDYLVIATGHADSVPKSRTERLKQFEAENQKIKSADSVLIIGGGPSGVELAGEIAVDFPEKKVTLVHRGSRLLEFIGFKASTKTVDWLTSKKVEVLLQQSISVDSISNEENTTFETSTGEKVTANCHFMCTGEPLGSAWLKETVLKDSLDKYGRLMVDQNLRVKGRKNIFAIGDITDIREIKQGFYAQRHASVAAKNLKLLMSGEKEAKMAIYKAGSPIALVSLGRKEAVAQFPYMTVIGCLPGMIKSKDLFVGRTRKKMGLSSN